MREGFFGAEIHQIYSMLENRTNKIAHTWSKQEKQVVYNAIGIYQYVEQQVVEIEQWAVENKLDEVLVQTELYHDHDCPCCKCKFFFEVLGIYTDRNQTKTFNRMWRLFNEIERNAPEAFVDALMEVSA
jgi:hypothetical protein